ncbi:MAG TPA: ROK family protein [Planctomycetota bacterium]|nr:ROK family protein [Planctomycetota bacterium]
MGRPRKVLTLDIGGNKLKAHLQGDTQVRKARTGPEFTPDDFLKAVRTVTRAWTFDAISIGYPGLVGESGPKAETQNLGRGWVGFDAEKALGRPVRWVNDAGLQALGSYERDRMLFLGLGTGLGSSLVVDRRIVTLELGDLPYGDDTLGRMLGRRGLRRLGKKVWRKTLLQVLPRLQRIFLADDLVLGGGLSGEIRVIPLGVRIVSNVAAGRGGVRLWESPPWVLL